MLDHYREEMIVHCTFGTYPELWGPIATYSE